MEKLEFRGRKELRELLHEPPEGLLGIVKLLNCQFDEAAKIFSEKSSECPFLAAGLTLTAVVQFLTSFEDLHKVAALSKLKDLETSCGSDSGHFKKVIRGFLKTLPIDDASKVYSDIASLNLDIITADAYLYSAIITTLNMDLSSYLKAGWLIRKAWRLYETSHSGAEVLHERHSHRNIRLSKGNTVQFICDKCLAKDPDDRYFNAHQAQLINGNSQLNGTSSIPGTAVLEIDITDMSLNGGTPNSVSYASSSPFLTPDEADIHTDSLARNIDHATCCQCDCLIEKLNWVKNDSVDSFELLKKAELSDMVDKLLGDVSFGYGLFHLCMSILSPQIVRVIQFLGFSSDRRLGLKCLQFASGKSTMKGPLATLTLLWFHCVARPFFGLDTVAVNSVIEDGRKILRSMSCDLASTVLCLYFRGKIERLECHLHVAIDTYTEALAKSGEQRELRLICQYELGWCYLLLLQWNEALVAFTELKENSKWSPGYYTYLLGLCSGAAGQYPEAVNLMLATIKAVQKKNNQIEAFVMHQATRIVAQSKVKQLNSSVYILQIVELMYLWRALPQCSEDILGRLLSECNKVSDLFFTPLKCLLEGSIFSLMKDKRKIVDGERGIADDQGEIAIERLEDCLKRVEGRKEERHIAAFASYEIGLLWCQKPETKEKGKQMLYAAKDKYKSYDFENRLSMRVNAAIKNFKL